MPKLDSLEDQLVSIGMQRSDARIFERRRGHSEYRLDELRRHLEAARHIAAYPNLTIYAAGSYGRGEASEHSDVDLFFIHNDKLPPKVEEPNLSGIRVISTIIREMEEGMEFPPPSNDGQFLNIIPLEQLLFHLGGPEDDYRNHFTARMLLILESKHAWGAETFEAALGEIVDSYTRDYEDHSEDFHPTFLVNDILRFWKTLCLNYEHKRNQQDETKKVKQKIRNFKLKFSRLSTCFSTVALLASYNVITREDLLSIFRLTPVERLLLLTKRRPEVKPKVSELLTCYAGFLQLTEKSKEDLELYFSVKENRRTAFKDADIFGTHMYELVKGTAESCKTLRFLLV